MEAIRNRLFFLLLLCAAEQKIFFEDRTGRAYYEVDNGTAIIYP
jgi:hypothetical protein